MAQYPDTLPSPQLSDYAIATSVGATAVTFEHGNRRQRRSAKRDKHEFALSFIFTTAQLWQWQSWANVNGYDWHTMSLESAYSGAAVSGDNTIPHTVRYTSDITVEAFAFDYFRVTVQAEMDVNTIPQGIVLFTGDWIIARTPSNPATDRIIAGTPAALSANIIIAGSPDLPAA